MRRFPRPKPRWAWITISTLIPTAVLGVTLAGVFSETFRDWLLSDESGSATIRNLGLVLAGLIALPLAIWRGLVAEKQANAAQQSLRNERYQKGAEMLGGEELSVRMGGIYALQRLADEHPEEYHVQIMRLFCAFVRYPTRDDLYDDDIQVRHVPPFQREDVVTVLRAIGKRDEARKAHEKNVKYRLDLSTANISRLLLFKVNLSGASCIGTQFVKTVLEQANLSEAILELAFLEKTSLRDANLSGTRLHSVTGLIQSQLDQARAYPDNPPKLEGALDAETGLPLVWTGGRGAPLRDES